MGFKDLFIERDESEGEDIDLDALTADLGGIGTDDLGVLSSTDVADIDVTDGLDFVAATYDANHISDFSTSIFKVEDLMNTLPKEMPTATKRQTVTGIMATVGLDTESVVNDGVSRSEILSVSLANETSSINNEIAEMEDTIENLKKQIADNEKSIADSKQILSKITAETNNELDRIKSLVEFIKGE